MLVGGYAGGSLFPSLGGGSGRSTPCPGLPRGSVLRMRRRYGPRVGKAMTLRIRQAEPADYDGVIAVLDDWWGGRPMRDMLPRLLFTHFRQTSFVAELDGDLAGFLVGFLSQTFPDEAYVHFVGVAPASRSSGVARALYERFFAAAKANGRTLARCVTSRERGVARLPRQARIRVGGAPPRLRRAWRGPRAPGEAALDRPRYARSPM